MSQLIGFADGGLPDARPLVLHIELAPGARADLEVVARAAIAFVETVREVAFVTDPMLEIRVELVSGTEGSLRLLTWIRSLRAGDVFSRKSLLVTTCAVGIWFGKEVASWGLEYVRDWIIGQAGRVLSPAEVEEIAERVVARLEGHVGRDQAERFFLELRRDPAIMGVGTGTVPDIRPETIVPRDEFATQVPAPTQTSLFLAPADGVPRVRNERTILTLISPVLLPTNERAWRVKGSEGEFGVYIWDPDFLDAIASGQLRIALTPDLLLDVDLRTTEVQRDGVWVVKQRRIIKVNGIFGPPSQSELDMGR